MRATHPIDELAVLATQERAWPSGVVGNTARIVGTAFFPGGSGLWRAKPEHELPSFPERGVLVVGHDFGTVTQYVSALRAGSEPVNRNPTWRGLTATLAGAGIPLPSCFFTNAYLGLRSAESPTGAFPGRTDGAFRDQSLDVLLQTILWQRPHLIITLGAFVPPLVATLSPDDLSDWLKVRSLRELDEVGALKRDVSFMDAQTGQTHRATAVALTHPSLGAANAHRRRVPDSVLLGQAYASIRE